MKGQQQGGKNDYNIRAKVKAGQEDVPHEPKAETCTKVDTMNLPSEDAAL